MFTSFLFEPSFGVVDLEEGMVRALGSWENGVTVTTPRDIGKITARVVIEEPRVKNEVVYTAGETISYGELADVVEEVTGRKIERKVWTVQELKKELKGDPENGLRKYRVVFAEGKGVSWGMEETFNAQKGIETQDVLGWAKENLAV
jgi:hypothetical protein